MTHMQENRTEVYSPPYALDTATKPMIISLQPAGATEPTTVPTAVVRATYGQALTLVWAPADAAAAAFVNVTSVSLVAPGVATHGHNANQRLVWLPIVARDDALRQVTVRLPPNTSVAPPQMYLLFANNGDTYSRAWWVHLRPSLQVMA
jgi:hypothetical protein